MFISSGAALGLLIIPILAILIVIHELGHFFAARSVGVKVEEFGLGIPPRAKGWYWKGVLWSLNWIPFGGFVRVKGEDATDFSEGSMNSKGPLQRGFFLVAGPAMNFVAAVVLCIVMVGFQGITSDTSTVYINKVESGSPATTAGWQPGDAFVSVDGARIETTGQLSDAIDGFDDKPVTVVLKRGDEQIETTVTPRGNPPEGQGATGIIIVEGKQSFVKINHVAPGSPAEAAGVQPGDRITAIDGLAVESEAQVRSLLDAAAGGSIELTVNRDGNPVSMTVDIPQPRVMLSSVGQHSPAAEALLYRGDQITRIGGTPIAGYQSLFTALAQASGQTVEVSFVREGKPGSVQLHVPELQSGDDPLNVIGVNIVDETAYLSMGIDGIVAPIYEKVPLTQVVPEGWNQFWGFMTVTFDGLQRMATEGVDRNDLAGPVGMGQVTSELLSESATPAWFTLTFIMVVISVGLGVLNLLPIPALDGGRLLFVIIEILRGGKRISPEKEGLVHLAGMVILLALMFLVAFGDISRLIDGRKMLP